VVGTGKKVEHWLRRTKRGFVFLVDVALYVVTNARQIG